MRRVVLVLGVMLVLATTATGRYITASTEPPAGAKFVEVFNVPRGSVIRDLSLGWITLAADLLFVRANVYYGHHILGDEELPWLDAFIDSLLELDPDFRAAYIWGSLVSRFRTRQAASIPQHHIERSTEILLRGMRRFPDDYRFPFRIAYNYYYELGQLERALPYFEAASRLPGAPDWLAQKLADLYNKRGQRELAVRILEHLIATTEDPALNQGLRDRLLALLERPRSEALLAEHRALVSAWRQQLPFVSFDLYLALRPLP